MLQCISFPSLLKQPASFRLRWLALAAGDGRDAPLPSPAAHAALAPSAVHLPWRGTAVSHGRLTVWFPSTQCLALSPVSHARTEMR